MHPRLVIHQLHVLSIEPSIHQPADWTFGASINNAWSIAGKSDRETENHMLLNLFIIGTAVKGSPHTFLCTDRCFEDIIPDFEVWLVYPERNSGMD